MSSTNWIKIGTLDSIPVLGSRRLCRTHLGKPVAVFRTSDNQVFALIDECPHKKGPLSEGIVAGHTVACPLHGMVIDLGSGTAALPDEGKTETLAVSVIDGGIYVHIPEAITEALA